MVDSVSGNVPSFIRAQQVAGLQSTGSAAIAQKIINQTQSNAVVRVSTNAVSQVQKTPGFSATQKSKAPLPRGSLIDVLA